MQKLAWNLSVQDAVIFWYLLYIHMYLYQYLLLSNSKMKKETKDVYYIRQSKVNNRYRDLRGRRQSLQSIKRDKKWIRRALESFIKRIWKEKGSLWQITIRLMNRKIVSTMKDKKTIKVQDLEVWYQNFPHCACKSMYRRQFIRKLGLQVLHTRTRYYPFSHYFSYIFLLLSATYMYCNVWPHTQPKSVLNITLI